MEHCTNRQQKYTELDDAVKSGRDKSVYPLI